MTFFSKAARILSGADREAWPSDLDLADLGLSRMDYETLTNAPPGARDRMIAMAGRFDVEEAEIDRHRDIALLAATTCAQCALAGRCQISADGGKELDKTICPNAGLYEVLSVG